MLELDDPEDLAVDLDVAAVLELVGGDHGAERSRERPPNSSDRRRMQPWTNGRPALSSRASSPSPSGGQTVRSVLRAGRPGPPGWQGRPDAGDPEQQVEDVVLGVDRDDAEDRVAVADDEAPGRDDQVHDAQRQRVAAGRVGAGPEGQQAEDAGQDVHDVVPAVDVEDPEHRVPHALVAGELGVVEEADDSGDHEDRADDARVEHRWCRTIPQIPWSLLSLQKLLSPTAHNPGAAR